MVGKKRDVHVSKGKLTLYTLSRHCRLAFPYIVFVSLWTS